MSQKKVAENEREDSCLLEIASLLRVCPPPATLKLTPKLVDLRKSTVLAHISKMGSKLKLDLGMNSYMAMILSAFPHKQNHSQLLYFTYILKLSSVVDQHSWLLSAV
ncbi:hypothetical protein EVAR_11999_1 [Eumeta japonica]|uniref:Uncharacterized protein n=1 Tax=Eumeta variegata TaxID=151549 RepID=A0A4C1U558_EUMVA|nr:hypothetical protein EVAR_11999_1 [Eumeta japonica]